MYYEPGDEGRIKRVDKNTILEAIKVIKEGTYFDLGLEINKKMPGIKDGVFPFSMLFCDLPENTDRNFKKIEKDSKISTASEVIIGNTHTSTHIDSLCHWQLDGKVIEKYNIEDIRTAEGWRKCGSETIPPIIGRGVLIDIAKYLNKDKLEDEHLISLEEVKGCLKKFNLHIKFGDIVCVRSGKVVDAWKEDYYKKGPGIGAEAANWLADQGMCALCFDYGCIDGIPFKDFNNTTHINLICKKRIHLIESIYLEELSQNNIFDFFIFCSSLKFTGATGSWVRPVAII